MLILRNYVLIQNSTNLSLPSAKSIVLCAWLQSCYFNWLSRPSSLTAQSIIETLTSQIFRSIIPTSTQSCKNVNLCTEIDTFWRGRSFCSSSCPWKSIRNYYVQDPIISNNFVRLRKVYYYISSCRSLALPARLLLFLRQCMTDDLSIITQMTMCMYIDG